MSYAVRLFLELIISYVLTFSYIARRHKFLQVLPRDKMFSVLNLPIEVHIRYTFQIISDPKDPIDGTYRPDIIRNQKQ